MDKAIWGTMRWGYFRWGVYTDHWERFQKSIEDLPLKSMGGIDPFVTGYWRTGHVRTGVYLPLFDKFMASLGVTREAPAEEVAPEYDVFPYVFPYILH